MKCRLAVLLLFLPYLTGCTSWRPVTVGLRELIEVQQPERIRILQADGTQLELKDPRVESDSLAAEAQLRREERRPDGMGMMNVKFEETVRIALTDVSVVDVRRFSLPKTVGAIVAGATGFVVLLFLVCVATECLDGA